MKHPKPYELSLQWSGEDPDGDDDYLETESFDSEDEAYARARELTDSDDPPAWIVVGKRFGFELIDPLGVWEWGVKTLAEGSEHEDFEPT